MKEGLPPIPPSFEPKQEFDVELRMASVCYVHSSGMNCIKIGSPGKLILSKRKGLWEVLFS